MKPQLMLFIKPLHQNGKFNFSFCLQEDWFYGHHLPWLFDIACYWWIMEIRTETLSHDGDCLCWSCVVIHKRHMDIG